MEAAGSGAQADEAGNDSADYSMDSIQSRSKFSSREHKNYLEEKQEMTQLSYKLLLFSSNFSIVKGFTFLSFFKIPSSKTKDYSPMTQSLSTTDFSPW